MADLQPAYTLTTADQQWTSQLLLLEVVLAAAPLVGTLDARLPAQAPLVAAVGDPIRLDLDAGEGGAIGVFTGTITAIRRDPGSITVHALDPAGALARLRPATTYNQVTAATVIRDLADQAGVDVGDVDDGPALAWYAADPSRSALDHVARLCAWSGALARIDGDGALVATAVAATQGELALKFGRELLGIEQTARSRPVQAFTYAGEAGAGTTDAPEALRPTSDFFAGNRPAGPDSDHRWSFEPALRTTEAAAAAGRSAQWRYAARAAIGTLTAFLQPRLRPGTVVEIAELPKPLDGSAVWLDRIRHRLNADAALTTARMHAGGPPAGAFGGPPGAGSLIGAASSALGL